MRRAGRSSPIGVISISTAATLEQRVGLVIEAAGLDVDHDGQEAAEAVGDARLDEFEIVEFVGHAGPPCARPAWIPRGMARACRSSGPKGSSSGTVQASLAQGDGARIARHAVEVCAAFGGECLQPVEPARALERLRIEFDRGVGREDARAAARRLPSCAARAARCRCRGRSAHRRWSRLRAAPRGPVRASAPAGNSGAGGCRPRTCALRLSSRCCGVIVAATPLRAPRTNSAAARVVMCSNTTLSCGTRSTMRLSTRSMNACSRSKTSTLPSVTSPWTCSTRPVLGHRLERGPGLVDRRDAGVGMRRCAGRVELGADDETAGCAPCGFRRATCCPSGTASSAVRTCSPAGTAARMRARYASQRRRGRHRRLEVRHHQRTRELPRGERQHGGQLRAVAQVQVPVVGSAKRERRVGRLFKSGPAVGR